jgi:hypothetical protein
MLFKILILFLFCTDLYAIITPGDAALYQIATNTLNSVRDLNEIIREQREFGDNFERIYSKVDQTVWKADRTILWAEDMKELGQVQVENLDDFNYVLAQLKDETTYLRNHLVKSYRSNQEIQKRIDQSKREEKRSLGRVVKYSSETKSSLSPQMAQVETSKNTKDLLIENARFNAKIDKLSIVVGELTKTIKNQETKQIKKNIIETKKLGRSDKGILKPHEVKP